MKKALPIEEALYQGYKLLFLFDNATSDSIYAQDEVQVANRNKGPEGQQLFLRPGWLMGSNQEIVVQKISTVITDPLNSQSTTIQKGIQAVLIEQGYGCKEEYSWSVKAKMHKLPSFYNVSYLCTGSKMRFL